MIGVTGYPIEPLNELIERSTVQIDMVLCYTRGSLADQKLNEYLPKWKERGIFVVNASPLAMGLFRNDGPQPWHPANNDLKEKVKECIEMCNQRGHNISRIALRYAIENIAADIVLCGTARVKELEENILNAKTPLNEDEIKTMNDILEMLKGLSGHWEGRELEAYNNRLKDIEDDLPFFRD
jgi:aryl-alcohol dehydrogenase-like predicted oxidoreductase